MVKIKVQCVEDDDLDLDDGDYIVFAEVEGMPGLNDQMPLPVLDVSKGKKSFIMAVPAAAAAGTYTRGGLITEKRMPKDVVRPDTQEMRLDLEAYEKRRAAEQRRRGKRN